MSQTAEDIKDVVEVGGHDRNRNVSIQTSFTAPLSMPSSLASIAPSIAPTATHGVYQEPILYTIHVSSSPSRTFRLSQSQILNDSPNLFTSAFLSSLGGADGTGDGNSISGFVEGATKTIYLPDRNPNLFELIVDHLSGYLILPLEVGVGKWSVQRTRDNLLRDAEYLGLEGLKTLIAEDSMKEKEINEGQVMMSVERTETARLVKEGFLVHDLSQVFSECVVGDWEGGVKKIVRVTGVRLRFETRPLMASFTDPKRLLLFSIELPGHLLKRLQSPAVLGGPVLLPASSAFPSPLDGLADLSPSASSSTAGQQGTFTIEGRMRPTPYPRRPRVFPLLPIQIADSSTSCPVERPSDDRTTTKRDGYTFGDLDQWLTLDASGRLGTPSFFSSMTSRWAFGSLIMNADWVILQFGRPKVDREPAWHWGLQGILGFGCTTIEKGIWDLGSDLSLSA